MIHFSSLKQDLPASLVVFFVALPLCLGIALASGAPLFSGLIAGIVGGVVVGLLSGSHVGVSGPAAGLAVIVLSSIHSLGSFRVFLLAVVLSGVIQIIFGLLKSGVIAYYFPSSVINGMLSGIGIIIILKQIPHALGYDKDYEGSLSFLQSGGENSLNSLYYMFAAITPGALVVSSICISILLLWEFVLLHRHKLFSLIQGPLVAVVSAAVLQYFWVTFRSTYALSEEHLVSVPIVSDYKSLVGLFTFPDFSHLMNGEVYLVACTLAIVASLETLLCVEATDKLDPYKRTTPANRELCAQGFGNIISGLVGGLPITQVIVRSSANVQSGGRSKLSTISHGVLLLLAVLFIPHIINKIPLAALACILIVVGYKLAKPVLFAQMYKKGADQFVPFIATVIGIVFSDLLKGIVVGLAVGVFIILRNSFRNSHFLHIEGSHPTKQFKMTLAEEVSFLNKGAILNELNKIPNGASLTIDTSKSIWIDEDVKEIIENFRASALQRRISLVVE